MAKHNHHEHNDHLCETHLGLCKRCDVVYCVQCGKEWGNCKLSHYPYTYIYPTPSVYPYTCGICNCTPCMCGTAITWASSVVADDHSNTVASTCDHSYA